LHFSTMPIKDLLRET